MGDMATEIQTCSRSLLHPGECCGVEIDRRPCRHPATLAVLTADMVEHTRCEIHAGDAVASKPLQFDPAWAGVMGLAD